MINANTDTCLSYIHGHTALGKAMVDTSVTRAVTISRQAGCGGALVAEKLAAFLQQYAPRPGINWAIFDRELMDKVLADHHLPAHLAKFLPEDRVSQVEDALAELFGVHPPSSTMVAQTAETILSLTELGNVIIIGRAGNMITARLPHVLHVRLVAPLEDRIERICRDDRKTPAEARKFCVEEELARARYLKTYYKTDINDPLQYHLIINTSRVGYEIAAKLIGGAMLLL